MTPKPHVVRDEYALFTLQGAGEIWVFRTAALIVDGDGIVTLRLEQVGDLNREVLVDLNLMLLRQGMVTTRSRARSAA